MVRWKKKTRSKDFIPMWGIKRENNKQANKLITTDNRTVVTEGKCGRMKKGKIHGSGRRLDCG